jgi:hypothetical protein
VRPAIAYKRNLCNERWRVADQLGGLEEIVRLIDCERIELRGTGMDNNGNLLGTTARGGDRAAGIIFEVKN